MVERSARLLALICAAYFFDNSNICSNWAALSRSGAVLTPRVLRASVTSNCSNSTLSPALLCTEIDTGVSSLETYAHCPFFQHNQIKYQKDFSGSRSPPVDRRPPSQEFIAACIRVTST
jgi:hypothetical protein